MSSQMLLHELKMKGFRHWRFVGRTLIFGVSEPCDRLTPEESTRLMQAFDLQGIMKLGYPRVGSLRESTTELVAGSPHLTVIHENGVIYLVDFLKVLFSFRNRRERRRMAELRLGPSETIIDMFAGLGYWSLPLARAGASKILAIDLNPVQCSLLTQAAAMNHLTQITVRCDDARSVQGESAADRLIFGFFTKDQSLYETAERLIKNQGIMHLHCLVREHEEQIQEIKQRFQSDVEILSKNFVKSFAPGVKHWVYDLKFQK